MEKPRFESLPDEAVVKIFTKLPVKTLIRSTSVCKKWYSQITNPKFISSHIQHSLSCCNQNALLFVPTNIQRDKYCSVVLADTGDLFEKYKIPVKTKNGSLLLCGSFNGVLCLNVIGSNPNDPLEFRELCLWNPGVGKYKTLSASCFKKQGACCYGLGLGVYEPTFDFRVVRIVYPLDDRGDALGILPPKAEIYSLKRNTWKRIINPGVNLLGFNVGLTVGNNMTYWLNSSKYQDGCLLSFDFNSEVFGKIQLPDNVRYCVGVGAKLRLMKFEGKLAVCVLNDRKKSDGTCSQPCYIWLMSHEDGQVSWTLRFKIVLEKHMWPLTISRAGTLLMVSHYHRASFVRDLMTAGDLQQSKPLVIKHGGLVDSHFIESLLML